MEEIDDFLGFDPSQLNVFNPDEGGQASNFSSNIYRPRAQDSISKDKVYRATIKPLYNPFDYKQSVLERQTYYLTDKDGGFEVVSSLTNKDKNCPIFKAWKKCHYAEPGSVLFQQANTDVQTGGKARFDKRFSRFIPIQVINDPNKPELNGRYMLWKCPAAIWEMMDSKMHPAPESGKPTIPIMDPFYGKAIDLEITPGPGAPGTKEYARGTSYAGSEFTEDCVSCTNPDGSSLFTEQQQAVLAAYIKDISEVWKTKDPEARRALASTVANSTNTAEFKTFYKSVLEKLKEFTPNLIDELGYKAWDEKTSARVNAWIDVILAGGDPAEGAPAPTATSPAPATSAVSSSAPADKPAAPTMSPETDDLPF